MANQNEGCSCGGHHHDEEHGHGGCCGHHGEHGHGEHGHGGCCGHHGHGGCNHAKDQIGVFKVGPLETNCYIYVSGNECMIIDAGASGAEIAAQLLNLELKYIVATHGHADHVGGVKALKLAVPGAQYLINEADNELAQRAHTSNEIYDDAPEPDDFLHEGDNELAQRAHTSNEIYDDAPEPDDFLHEGDVLSVGTAQFKIMETPGHTPGGIVLVGEGTATGAVFVGDTLFQGSAGRTDLPGGNFETLKASLNRIKTELDPTSVILSGHGNQTSLEAELATNPFLQD